MSDVYKNFGRQAPRSTGHDALRSWLGRGAVFALSAALTLAPAKEGAARDTAPLQSPVAAERIEAEIAAFEASFEGLDVVNISTTRHTNARDEGSYDPDSFATLGETYFEANLDSVTRTLLRSFNRAGTFDTRPGRQISAPEDYFADKAIPERQQEINTAVAQHITQLYENSLSSPRATDGFAVVLHFGEDTPERICATLFTNHTTDEQTFMAGFAAGAGSKVDLDLTEIYQFVANHELAHCVYSQPNIPTWFNEILADNYAIARHIQLNGDDGFAEVVLNSRQLGAEAAGDIHHYTTPGIKRILPQLKEAHHQGKLEGMTPRELGELTFEMLLGNTPEEAVRNYQELTQEMASAQRVLSVFNIVTTLDAETGTRHLEESLIPEAAALFAPMVERHNHAIEALGQPLTQLDAAQINTSEAESRFRAELAEQIQVQPSAAVALEGLHYRLWNMRQAEQLAFAMYGEDKVAELHQAHDATGVRFGRQREILEGLSQELERSGDLALANTPNRMQER